MTRRSPIPPLTHPVPVSPRAAAQSAPWRRTDRRTR